MYVGKAALPAALQKLRQFGSGGLVLVAYLRWLDFFWQSRCWRFLYVRGLINSGF